MYIYPKEKRHFRGHKTIVNGKLVIHPAYIVGEDGGKYLSFTLTHSKKKGKGHYNHKLIHNPDHSDPRPAYLKKQLESNPKSTYTDWILPKYKLSEEDDPFVDRMMSKRRL